MPQTLSKVESPIETEYLESCRKSEAAVNIHLMNGTKLNGRITKVGIDALVLERSDNDQLVWYHAMSTVSRVVPKA